MRSPQVENGVGVGAVQRCVCTSTRTWPFWLPVPTKRLAGAGSVQVLLTWVEPRLCGWAGGPGTATQPLEVAVEQPLAPAIVQSHALTVCSGTFVVSTAQVVPVVDPQFLPA